MATLNDLKNINETTPQNLDEWLSRFDDQDRGTVIGAILRGSNHDLFPILSALDDNPYPFEIDTLNHHRRVLRKRGINV